MPVVEFTNLPEKENGINEQPEKQDVAASLHPAKERPSRILRYAEVYVYNA